MSIEFIIKCHLFDKNKLEIMNIVLKHLLDFKSIIGIFAWKEDKVVYTKFYHVKSLNEVNITGMWHKEIKETVDLFFKENPYLIRK